MTRYAVIFHRIFSVLSTPVTRRIARSAASYTHHLCSHIPQNIFDFSHHYIDKTPLWLSLIIVKIFEFIFALIFGFLIFCRKSQIEILPPLWTFTNFHHFIVQPFVLLATLNTDLKSGENAETCIFFINKRGFRKCATFLLGNTLLLAPNMIYLRKMMLW